MDRYWREQLGELAKHRGVAWVGIFGNAGGDGDVAGCAVVQRHGALRCKDAPGWWCVYLGVPAKYEASLRELDANGDIHGGITFSTLSGMEEAEQSRPPAWAPLELKSFCWIGWDYAHAEDFTGLVEDDDGKSWSLEEIVEQELKGAVSQLRIGCWPLARELEGRVVSPREWVYER